jgi:uncharacterized RDD family membrane protein YckC
MNNELLDDLDYLEERIPEYIYGGFWKRLGAAMLDGFVLMIIVVFWIVLEGLFSFILPIAIVEFFQNIGSLIIMILYFPLFEISSAEGSIGKYTFGMKVVDENGQRITFWRALARIISKQLSCALFFAGFFMIGLSEKKQGLHDLIVKTYVVER